MYTERYATMELYLNQRLHLQVTFQKYGLLHGTGNKATCLKDIKLDGTIVIDHIWVNSQTLLDAKLRTNQAITIEATVRLRKRPPTDIFQPPIKDIQLLKITILTKGKK